jgi:four helix bundle protein
MTEIRSFKDLQVWQKSFLLVKELYKLTAKLPASERFGLFDQIRRAAISIPSNIAEGSKRGSRRDYAQFLRIAHGSSTELETQLLLVKELYNIEVDNHLLTLTEIQKMLHVIIKKLTCTTTYKLQPIN